MKVPRAAIALGAVLVAGTAWATSPPIVAKLSVSEDAAGTVRICEYFPIRGCPDQGVLREDPSTGEVVKLDACIDGCWVDECVPAGTYRYGLAEPYECLGPAQYYTEATVVGAAEGCTRTLPAPVPASGVPWPDGQQWICGAPGPGGPSCSAAGDGGGLGTNLFVVLAALALSRWRSRPSRA